MSIIDDYEEAIVSGNYWRFLLTHGCDPYSRDTGEEIPEGLFKNEVFVKYSEIYKDYMKALAGDPNAFIEHGDGNGELSAKNGVRLRSEVNRLLEQYYKEKHKFRLENEARIEMEAKIFQIISTSDSNHLPQLTISEWEALLKHAISHSSAEIPLKMMNIAKMYLPEFDRKSIENYVESMLLSSILNQDIPRFYDLIRKLQLLPNFDDLSFINSVKLNSEEYVVFLNLLNASKSELQDTDRELLAKINESKLTKTIIASQFKTDLSVIAGMIFTKNQDISTQERYESPAPSYQVISNNEDYGVWTENPGLYGNPLYVDSSQQTPIGYNIHIPSNGEVKNVVVQVYGGDSKNDAKPFYPRGLTKFDEHLLNNGTMVITLNLPDLLKLDVNQKQMSEELHSEIHAAIHQFYQTLTKNPENLHPALVQHKLQDKKIFLYGTSFGGLMAVRHAELYPETFAGYISHDGALSNTMQDSSDRLKRGRYNPWMDASIETEMDKLVDPLLLMQNRDDNNVNAKVTLYFYQQLAKRGKAHLARLGITQSSNPAPSRDNIQNKGHFLPTGKTEFLQYAELATLFMTTGMSQLPQITRWQAFKEDLLANKYYQSATPSQKFVAEILEEARFDKAKRDLLKEFANSSQSNEVFNQHFAKLFYQIYYVNKICNNEPPPGDEFRRLQALNLPMDEMFKKALLTQADTFVQYFKEAYGLTLTKEDITSKEWIDEFKSMFSDTSDAYPNNKPIVNFMYSSLYKANPELLEHLYLQYERDTAIQEELNAAKKDLKDTLLKRRKLVAHAFRASAHLALKNEAMKSLEAQIKDFNNATKKPTLGSYIQLAKAVKKAIIQKNEYGDVLKLLNETILAFKNQKFISPSHVEKIMWLTLVKATISNNSAQTASLLNEAKELYIKMKYPYAHGKHERDMASIQINDYFAKITSAVSNKPKMR